MGNRGNRKRKTSQDEGERGRGAGNPQSAARKTRHCVRGKQRAKEVKEKGEGRGNQSGKQHKGGAREQEQEKQERGKYHPPPFPDRPEPSKDCPERGQKGARQASRDGNKQQTTERAEGTEKQGKWGVRH